MLRSLVFCLCVLPVPGLAGPAEVLAAEAVRSGNGWSFAVTIRHGDTGWDHYADGWVIEAPDGTQLGYRELLHPHVDEQPFTRSLSGVQVPAGIGVVYVRAHDSVHGWSDDRVEIVLPQGMP
ncbi:MAG: hypothetical protein ACE368_19350 [Paracoccaceae bacterium]